MRSICAVLLVALLLAPAGCRKTEPNGTPTTPTVIRVSDAMKAGELAAYGFLIAYQGDANAATVRAVEGTITHLAVILKDYKKKGFKAALPEVSAKIDLLFNPEIKKAENLLAKKLAETLLDELQNQFDKHPEWKAESAPYIELVQGFLQGSSSGFLKYRSEKRTKKPASK